MGFRKEEEERRSCFPALHSEDGAGVTLGMLALRASSQGWGGRRRGEEHPVVPEHLESASLELLIDANCCLCLSC